MKKTSYIEMETFGGLKGLTITTVHLKRISGKRQKEP